MKEKKNFSERMEKFLTGKGFYIVLFVCVAVVGVSAWFLLFSDYAHTDGGEEDYAPVMANVDAPVVTPDSSKTTAEPSDAAEPLTPVSEPVKAEPVGKTSVPEKVSDIPKTPEENEEDSKKTANIEDMTFIWPVSGSIAVEYSPSALLFSKTMNDWRTHDGIDIAAQMGAKVMSIADGTVLEAVRDDLLGTTVVIDHGAGLISQYSNLAAKPTVEKGDAVTMGSVIGSVGDTALGETGEVSHLHFALKIEGTPADPADYLPKR